MNSLISTPIEALRANINSTLSNRTIEVEMLPVPAKQTVEICNDLDTSWIDDVGHDLGQFIKVAMGLVVLLMVLFILACEHFLILRLNLTIRNIILTIPRTNRCDLGTI